MTPQEASAHDQKYKPRRRLKSRNRDMLISIPMYHEIPVKAAIVIDIGRSCLMSSILQDSTCYISVGSEETEDKIGMLKVAGGQIYLRL